MSEALKAERREKLLAHFTEQAGFCTAFGSPFTGDLIARMRDDIEAGGPTAALVRDWPTNPRADALSLRLAGALHYAALAKLDADLAAVYPNGEARADAASAWPTARAFFANNRPWTEEFIQSPPQTNETRRSIGLLAGFLTIASELEGPLDTLELGASAGLNLNWDRFAYRTADWIWNESGSVPIDTDWQGAPPPLDAQPRVRSRAACDQNPLDVSKVEERLRLRSYIWPDQAERLARFDGAANLAIAAGVNVERADAAEWLAAKLATRAQDGATIVYHSVFYQYPPRETREAIKHIIEDAGAAATKGAPLYWLRLEPEAALGGPRDSMRMFIDLVSWPGGERRVIAETDGHVRWVRSEL
ncbi:MAG: DUF2332 domain-containing protein [Hyphomonadaceae bacterium]